MASVREAFDAACEVRDRDEVHKLLINVRVLPRLTEDQIVEGKLIRAFM